MSYFDFLKLAFSLGEDKGTKLVEINKLAPIEMRKKILIQIIKEFWIQITLSTVWGVYRVYISDSSENNFTIFVTHFSTSLFLLSWMLGQLIRVKKQQRIEEEFGTVKSKLILLAENLEKQTQDLIGYSTGGESITYLRPSYLIGKEYISLHLINESQYPVFDIQIDWIDLDELVDLENGKLWTRHQKLFGNLYPNKGIMDAYTFDLDIIDNFKINLFINTRNKHISQAIRIKKVDGIPKIAYRVLGDDGVIIEQQIPEDYPGFNINNLESVFQ